MLPDTIALLSGSAAGNSSVPGGRDSFGDGYIAIALGGLLFVTLLGLLASRFFSG
jgi:hypothetical protein